MKIVLALASLLAVAFSAPEAPYPPSGWKPSGQKFDPTQQYGAPTQEYGPAEPATDAPTTQEPDSEQTGNSSRFLRLPGRTSAQYNQGSGQFFIVAADGSVQHIAIPSHQQNENEPESENVSNVKQSTTLGQLVRLPVSNAQIRTQTTKATQKSGRLVAHRQKTGHNQQPSSSQYRQQGAINEPEYFALTADGRLQRVQSRPTTSEKQVDDSQTTSSASNAEQSVILLTPEGRFQRVPVQAQQPVQREENGQYNLLLPSGQLQRVQFMNVLSPDNRLTSNVQYNEVSPLNGPVYTYGSPLVRVV